MRKIFRVAGDMEHFHTLVFGEADQTLLDMVQKMPFSSVRDVWIAPKVEVRLNEEISKDFPLGDCPFLLSHTLVLRKSAWEALRNLLEPYVEVLPLEFEGEDTFYAVHPLTVVDALDSDASEMEWYKDRILAVETYALMRARIPAEIPIFRVRGVEKLAVFVNESVFSKVFSEGLRGFSFDEVQLT